MCTHRQMAGASRSLREHDLADPTQRLSIRLAGRLAVHPASSAHINDKAFMIMNQINSYSVDDEDERFDAMVAVDMMQMKR